MSASDTTIFFKVSSPWQTYWEGEVTAISGENAAGVFDILPDHERFLTIATKPISIETPTGEQQQFDFIDAILVYADNVANLYTTDTAASLQTG